MSDNLPEDILIDILVRLSVKTLLRFRCVSKAWHFLISSPSFITHHLNKAAVRNNDLLFFKYKSLENQLDHYLLYPDKDFPRCHGQELDFPFEKLDLPYKDYYCNTHLVGSCNGLFFLCDVYLHHEYDKSPYFHKAAIWNPSIRKIVLIPMPTANCQSDSYLDNWYNFGFGFDSIHHDYKLVRIVYMETTLLPLAEVYSLRSGCWRMVEDDLKYFIQKDSSSAFVNGACHWTAVNWHDDALKVIVFFDLAYEKIGEMIVPDCVVHRDDMELTVDVVDGLLSLVASWAENHGEGSFSIWQMKEYGDAKSWTKLFDIEHFIYYGRDFLGFKKNGEAFFVADGELTSYFKTKNGSCRILGTKIWGSLGTFYLDSYVESLVLLNEANRVSEENSSHVADLDKKKHKKKGKKNMASLEIGDEENRVLVGAGSSSSATSRKIVTNEGTGASREHDFGAKNSKQTEKKKKNGKNSVESDDEANDFPGKHNSSASADSTVENETHEAPKELSSSGSNTNKKKGTKKKKGKN